MSHDDFKVIVCAVLQDSEGKVLLMRRKMDKKLGGFWEFPGGKLEHGENLTSALKRELLEECQIEIEIRQLLHVQPHVYDHGAVLILFYLSHLKSGTLQMIDHDAHVWISPNELADFPGLLPANREVQKILLRSTHE